VARAADADRGEHRVELAGVDERSDGAEPHAVAVPHRERHVEERDRRARRSERLADVRLGLRLLLGERLEPGRAAVEEPPSTRGGRHQAAARVDDLDLLHGRADQGQRPQAGGERGVDECRVQPGVLPASPGLLEPSHLGLGNGGRRRREGFLHFRVHGDEAQVHDLVGDVLLEGELRLDRALLEAGAGRLAQVSASQVHHHEGPDRDEGHRRDEERRENPGIEAIPLLGHANLRGGREPRGSRGWPRGWATAPLSGRA
jgi:hypothetical protein